MFALFKDGNQVGPPRSKEWDAAMDAHKHNGVFETKGDFGLDWLIEFRPGFEVRET